MSASLSSSELQIIENIFRQTWRGSGIARVYLFGSRANGTNQPYSDVDLLVECESSKAGILSEIAECLEESPLPYKVDIVNANNLASEYAHSVHTNKLLLFEVESA